MRVSQTMVACQSQTPSQHEVGLASRAYQRPDGQGNLILASWQRMHHTDSARTFRSSADVFSDMHESH